MIKQKNTEKTETKTTSKKTKTQKIKSGVNVDNFADYTDLFNQCFNVENMFINEKKSTKKPTKKQPLDSFSKNVIRARKNILKKDDEIKKKNNQRVKKCNKAILSTNDEYRDIYFTIDKFNNNGKKTVVYFIDSFYPSVDGVLVVLDNYATYLQKYYNVVVCAPKHKQQCYKMDKYFVLYVDSVYVKNQGYDLAFPQVDAVFQKYISLLKIDLIHIQSPFNMGNFGLMLAKKRKVPCLTTFHSQFKQNFYNAVKNETIAAWMAKIVIGVYQKSTTAITMNNFAKGVMKEYGLRKHVEIIPNATDLVYKDFTPEEELAVINKHKIDTNQFNLIYIGRFVEVKNVYLILDVIKELSKRVSGFNMIFMGYGPENSKMIKFCKDNKIDHIVKFTGKVDSSDEKAILIKNSNLLFFPSVYDTDGIVKMECACYGVPSICIENTGAGSAIKNDHNGFTEKEDVEELTNRLEFLIKNVDFVKKVGENAKIELYMTWEDVCEKLHELYQKHLKRGYLNNTKKNKKKTTQNI